RRSSDLWNPWSSGGRASHPSFATHACILTRDASTTRSHGDFTSDSTLPYPTPHHYGDRGAATTSAVYLAPLHSRRSITCPVSYYALFQGWLLLSQPPGCLRN